MLRFCLRVALFVGILLVVLEVVFRTVLPACEYPRGHQDAEFSILQFDTTWTTEGLRTSGNLCEKQGLWRVNNAGWNSIFDYPPRTNYERPRYAIVGNSFIEGWAVDVEKHVDAELQRLNQGKADVFAFGKSGATMAQYIGMMKYIEKNFDPDVYLIFMANRSIQSSLGNKSPFRFFVSKSDSGLALEAPQKVFDQNKYGKILYRSALARYLKINRQFKAKAMNLEIQGIEKASKTSQEVIETEDFQLASFLVSEMINAVPNDKIIFFCDGNRFAIYHDPDQAKPLIDYRLLEDIVSKEESCSVVDLTGAMQKQYGKTGNRFEFEHDSHWNEAGHKVAASALLEEIEHLIGIN